MSNTTYCARITTPIPYQDGTGPRLDIPVGPCLIEGRPERSFEIIWGPKGQCSATLPFEEIKQARELGHLILLD